MSDIIFYVAKKGGNFPAGCMYGRVALLDFIKVPRIIRLHLVRHLNKESCLDLFRVWLGSGRGLVGDWPGSGRVGPIR